MRAALKRYFLLSAVSSVLVLCQSYGPVTPPRPGAPRFTDIRLSEARLYGSFREAIRVTWRKPAEDSIGIRSYTLLRKTDADSVFDVFPRSPGIPADVDTFFDDLTRIGFQGSAFSLVKYRIFAVDSLGRRSDTAAACSLYIANQPFVVPADTATWCFSWKTYINGSVTCHLKLWDTGGACVWTSASQEGFGNDNFPYPFTACLPDSLRPLHTGTWYYAIYLFVMGSQRQSLKVDSVNAP